VKYGGSVVRYFGYSLACAPLDGSRFDGSRTVFRLFGCSVACPPLEGSRFNGSRFGSLGVRRFGFSEIECRIPQSQQRVLRAANIINTPTGLVCVNC
jgi:hypothetical protein